MHNTQSVSYVVGTLDATAADGLPRLQVQSRMIVNLGGEAPAEPLHYGNARLGRSHALPELHFVAIYRNLRLHPVKV